MAHEYQNLSVSEYELLFSNFLIDSWSFSKVSSFARNEKAFEMSYIYREPYKKSSSMVAGNAYHKALEDYFKAKKNGVELDIIKLQEIAFSYIDNIDVRDWKLQKTTPTIEQCILKTIKSTTSLIENFFKNIDVYDLKKIVHVEIYIDEFLTINGVDIPLPCHMIVDLVAETNDGKTVIIDHKSKAKFSDEKELAFSIGKQAITYYHGVQEKLKINIDEVWFLENKISKNRDGSPQINAFKVEMTKDNVKLYDALLYEPLQRMMYATSDPDYVYLINESDNFTDKALLYEFWSKTQISEVEDFNIPEHKKEIISNRLKKIRDSSLASINPKIIKKFRENASEFIQYNLSNKDMTNSEKIEHILRTLGIVVKVEHIISGFSNDTFLLNMSAGTKISQIYKYKLDIANALNVPSVRINKDLKIYKSLSYVAIEAEKKREDILLFDAKYLQGEKIPIGLDNYRNLIYWDLENQSTPHLLIGGATGSGKSVSLISTIEYAKLAGIDEIIILDPKYEFLNYNSKSINVFNEIEDIEKVMKRLVEVMNEMVKNGFKKRIMIVFDEFADALAQSKKGKDLDVKEMVQVGVYKQSASEKLMGVLPSPKMNLQTTETLKSLEENLRILLQKGRSVGFRIVSATQRASTKIITGDAKVNFPVQICFKVPKAIDSRVMLDEEGAESLIGKGDGLINSPEYSGLVRFQGFFKN